MERFASPDAPLTFVFPETRNPTVIGEPRASMTAGMRLGPDQRIFVNIRRFHRAEYDQDD